MNNNGILKWYPFLPMFIHSGNLNPKIYIYDDIYLPQNFKVWFQFWGIENNNKKQIYTELKVAKKYEVRKVTWTSYNSIEFIPYYEIQLPIKWIYKHKDYKQTLTITYDLIDELQYGNYIELYKNWEYTPLVEYIKY